MTSFASKRADLLFPFLLVLSLLSLSSCEKKNSTQDVALQDPKAALIQKGRSIYQTQCIACHNADPKRPGSIGPEIFGSSRELLEERILRAGYPQGYQPKRATKAMPAMPQLKNDLEAIHAYLNQ